jgi:hypothetical protein
MTNAQLAPAIIVPLVAWRIYVRVRRNIGRQPLQPKRMMTRIAILGLISLLITAASRGEVAALSGLAGGLLLSLPLAWLGLRLTRFEMTPEGEFYTPNTYVGVTLSLLLVGRLGYRFAAYFSAAPETAPSFSAGYLSSPVTMLLFGVTVGYYMAYSAGVLIEARRHTRAR